MSDLTYSGHVFSPAEDATREELGDAINDAEEYLATAREAASEARSCARGWEEYIEALEDRLGALDAEEIEA
jgi:acyl-CoA reductase-like NAD-dependent aldehyde dehydrogenase